MTECFHCHKTRLVRVESDKVWQFDSKEDFEEQYSSAWLGVA